jgi:NADPH-dependent curcumin reductase CurA
MATFQRITVRGYIRRRAHGILAPGLAELARLVASGKLKYRETIAHDLANAPEAFLGLLKGKNFGKQLVKLT